MDIEVKCYPKNETSFPVLHPYRLIDQTMTHVKFVLPVPRARNRLVLGRIRSQLTVNEMLLTFRIAGYFYLTSSPQLRYVDYLPLTSSTTV